MARPLLVLGGIVLIGAGAVMAASWVWPTGAHAQDQVHESIRKVDVDTDSGSVSIRADDVAETTVHRDFDYTIAKPEDSFSIDGDRLTLGDCGLGCSVDYQVIVPRGTLVSGGTDSGDLHLDGVGNVNVHVDSGSFSGNRLDGEVIVSATSGDIDLRLARARDVRAKADSGAVSVAVPRGKYRVEGLTDSGERDIGVAEDGSAPNLLQLDTDSGDVSVRPM